MVQFCDRKLHRMPSNRHFETRILGSLQICGCHSIRFALMLLREGWMQQDRTPTQHIARLKGCQEGAGPALLCMLPKTTPYEHGDWLSSGKLPPVLKQHQRCWPSFIRERWNKRQMCEFIAQNILLKEWTGLVCWDFFVVLSRLILLSVS